MEAKTVFPEDVLEEIFSRLIVRQLLQLRSVSTVWRSIIDKCRFIQKHCKIRYDMLKEEGDIPLFCDHFSGYTEDEDPARFCLISKKLENSISYLTADLNRDCSEYFTGKPEIFNYLFCGGVVNGVVLFRWVAEYFGLWNPAIRELKFIPHPRPNRPENVEEYTNILGLGFDPNCSNFKIIRSTDTVTGQDDRCERTRTYEIYSLTANSWKLLESPRDHRYLDLSMNVGVTDGYFNGAYHWAADEYDSETASDPCRFGLLTFNFSTEVFKLVDAPPPAWNGRPESEWCIDKYKDYLAVIFTSRNFEVKTCHFDIWVVNKFDDDDPTVPSSWKYLFTIGPPIPGCFSLYFRGFAWDGDMLLLIPKLAREGERTAMGEFECSYYNPTTCNHKRLGLEFLNCFRYVESLFPLLKL